MSATRRINIGFGAAAHALIHHEADLDGIPMTQYVRESAIWRSAYRKAERGDSILSAMRHAWTAMHRTDQDPDVELDIVVRAITNVAPAELNDLLRALDARDPTAGRLCRGFYNLEPGEYLPEEGTL